MTTDLIPEALQEAVGQNLQPVRPLHPAWRRTLVVATVVGFVLAAVLLILKMQLRSDLGEIPMWLSWGCTSFELMAGIFLVSALAAQVMPTAAVAVLMSRIVLSDVAALGVHPQSAAMVIALASSCAFMSPVGHPVNLLVMGMGGHRFTDYMKVGFGMTLVVFLVVMLVLPMFWPLTVAPT